MSDEEYEAEGAEFIDGYASDSAFALEDTGLRHPPPQNLLVGNQDNNNKKKTEAKASTSGTTTKKRKREPSTSDSSGFQLIIKLLVRVKF